MREGQGFRIWVEIGHTSAAEGVEGGLRQVAPGLSTSVMTGRTGKRGGAVSVSDETASTSRAAHVKRERSTASRAT